ncbi:unnamed protein product [Schistosoma turkestanicum]|nr:unnamed protein product [Schistosoma turkestanicum]
MNTTSSDDQNDLTENNTNPANKCHSPTTSSHHNTFVNSSFSSSDLCAWCQKPNLQTYKYTSFCQSVSLNSAKYKIKPVPVCCSQICFDNLRRAYFKNRRHQPNKQLLDAIPAMAISGRLPYTSDSVMEKFYNGNNSNTAANNLPATIINNCPTNKLTSKKRLHNHQSDQQCHHHQSQNTFAKSVTNITQFKQNSLREEKNYDLLSSFQLYSQLNDYINKHNVEMSNPLYDYIIQRLDINQFVNNFINVMNTEHVNGTTITNATEAATTPTTTTTNVNINTDQNLHINPLTIDNFNIEPMNSNVEYSHRSNCSNLEIMNFLNPLLVSTNKSDQPIMENTIAHINEYEMNCLNQPLIIPIPIPIYKTAPDLLNILHQYGYHSIDSCQYHYRQSNVDATTQTINSNQFVSNEIIDMVNDAEVNEHRKINEFNKIEFDHHFLDKNTENVLDLSASNKSVKHNLHRNCSKPQKQESLHQCQRQNKRYLNRRLFKQVCFSGIYKLIHPMTKHCYTVRITPVRR